MVLNTKSATTTQKKNVKGNDVRVQYEERETENMGKGVWEMGVWAGFWFGLMSESVPLLVREVEDVGVQSHVEDEEEDEGRADDGGHMVVAQGT